MEVAMGRHSGLIETLKGWIRDDESDLKFNVMQEAHGPQPPEMAEESAGIRERIGKLTRLLKRAEEDKD
jgi:hypothetical protein